MKKTISIRHLVIGLSMLCTAGLAVAMKPTIILADQYEKINLEAIVPKQFHGWRMEEMTSHLVNPEEQAAVSKIYSQTLARSYVNDQGERVMLSIAYGKDQSDSVGVHLPEGCYGGQGFSVRDSIKVIFKTSFGNIPAARLVATKGGRVEPITYWLTVGEKAVYGGWDMKKIKLQYALNGVVPDGLLMRVSSITPDVAYGYALQTRFTDELLTSLSPSQRIRLMGSNAKQS
jgi:EpsI family protein